MDVAAIVDSPQHVCCRYRILPFQPSLEAAGHRLKLVPYPDSLWRRFRLPSSLAKQDAVVVQRRLMMNWMLCRLRAASRRLVFDMDDAVFLRDSYHPRGLHDPRKLRRFKSLASCVDVVVVGNRFLGQSARDAGARRVKVIPTCVDPFQCRLADHQRRGDARMVWIGSSSTMQGIKAVAPILDSIGYRCFGMRLRLICDSFFSLRNLRVEQVRWSAAGESEELAQSDIGISWIPDDDWSRGKCGLKVLQYMAAGLPVVANPVGVHEEMVVSGETGFLAKTESEWVEAMRLLNADPELRQRMGQAGRRRVEERYSVAVGAALWGKLLKELALPPG